jgi:hypothetical protein
MRFGAAVAFLASAMAVFIVVAVVIAGKVRRDIDVMSPQAHRAIYDLSLDDTQSDSSVASLEGRMVVEWRGGPRCDGYTSEQRVVTRSLDDQGQTSVSDIRLNAWESIDGDEFRFDRIEYLNGAKGVHEYGTAKRKNGVVVLTVNEGAPKFLPDKVLFPNAFNLAMSKAMARGRTSFSRPLFDGAQESATLVTAFIGGPMDTSDETRKLKIGHLRYGMPLSRMSGRAIHMSYFDLGDGTPDALADAPPSFEMEFSAFPNGVMSDLRLIYEDAVVKGDLKALDYFKPGGC